MAGFIPPLARMRRFRMGALICTMKVPVGGQRLYAVEGSIEVTVPRNGATLARTCIDDTVVGTKGLPTVAKGDIVRVRAFSRVTFAVVTVAKAGADLRCGAGGPIPCP